MNSALRRININDFRNVESGNHLNYLLDPISLKNVIQSTIKKAREIDFDTIAVCGISGIAVAPSVAVELNKGIIFVRKPHEKNHSISDVQGTFPRESNSYAKYLIIDDIISTGATVKRIHYKLQQFNVNLKCVGVLMYQMHDLNGMSRKFKIKHEIVSLPFYGALNYINKD
jgi:adenine/guanine phosphoribosyltransferase-like PRPP-binding protein